MADDIGWFNLSCYNHGVMGYRTPNIDRIAQEGTMFTDIYGSRAAPPAVPPSSPARRDRTGLSKVGMPGATSA